MKKRQGRQHWTDRHGIALSLAVWGLLLLILSSVYASARYPSCSKDEDCEAGEICVKRECRGHGP